MTYSNEQYNNNKKSTVNIAAIMTKRKLRSNRSANSNKVSANETSPSNKNPPIKRLHRVTRQGQPCLKGAHSIGRNSVDPPGERVDAQPILLSTNVDAPEESNEDNHSFPNEKLEALVFLENSVQILTSGIQKIIEQLSNKSDQHLLPIPKKIIPSNNRSQTEYIDLPVKTLKYQGQHMRTSPVMFTEGCRVKWKDANDTMKDVTIMEAIKPNGIRKQPLYYVEIGNENDEIVSHDQLYIPSGSSTELRSDSTIDSTIEILPVSAQPDPHPVVIYESVDFEKSRMDTLRNSIDHLWFGEVFC
jgi:hypothetical protein